LQHNRIPLPRYFLGCGGICLSDSSKNRFHKNAFNGNGAATPGSSSGANNFGIGLEGMSNENQIEENEIGGNVNGVLVFATASGNVVRHNIIVGNPPAQVSVSFTATTSAGADIHDRHTSGGTNTFEDNFCLTYLGPSPAACPNGIKEGSEEAGRATVPLKGSNGPTTAIASFLSIATERANWQREIALALLPLAFLVAALVSSSRSRKHFSKA
jgi:parallel beta-helix repeat protein